MQQVFDRIKEVIFEWIDFALTILLETWWGQIILVLVGVYLLGLLFRVFSQKKNV